MEQLSPCTTAPEAHVREPTSYKTSHCNEKATHHSEEKFPLTTTREKLTCSKEDPQCSSVAQSCPTLLDSIDCSMPGFPVHHQLQEFTQTHAHRVGDAIQPSHPLSSPSPPAFNLSQHQGLFQWVTLHIRWPKYWSFSFNISPSNKYLGLISCRTDWISLQPKGLSRVLSNTTDQKHQFISAHLSL